MRAINQLQPMTPHQSYITSVSVRLQAHDSTALTLNCITASPNWIYFFCFFSAEHILDHNMKHVLEIEAEILNNPCFILLILVTLV